MIASAIQVDRVVKLADRYELSEGSMLVSGVQALVRLVFDQLRADRLGRSTAAAMVSGYPGSPLGGFDTEILRQKALCEAHGVVVQPGLNEELAATSVWGSQLVRTLPGARVDGVLGVWHGKAPGVDRASDALRHGNLVGADPRGGLLALCGDDVTCKSSSIPGASEATLAALGMPVVYPGTPQEAVELGRHAIALSRTSGLWAALKVVTTVADGVATVELGNTFEPVIPTVEFEGHAYVHEPDGRLLPPHSNRMEATLLGPRQELARAYARENGLNRITLDSPQARLGIIAAGAAYYDLREALTTLGVDDTELRTLGVRLLKIGMIWPLEQEIVRTFGRGLEEVVVLEDKGPFLETAVRDALYASSNRPRVIGKCDEHGHSLLPVAGALDAETIALAAGSRLLRLVPNETIASRLARLREAQSPTLSPVLPARTPFFCSGCPHNRSTDAPDGTLVAGGIGCHTMIIVSPTGKGNVVGNTQMGGEGAQWLGQAPFVEAPHLTQVIGDGTFHHSGSLAIRAAVAAGVNITYKLLYNGAVAMTGGQTVQGSMSVPDLTRSLEAEGVRKVIVTTDDVKRYEGVVLASIADIRPRSELISAQQELHEIDGVTVLVHDQTCAAELRRLRKRGEAPDPVTRIHINERVCEGCGDCGHKPHCVSVAPVETEFGSKTRIDQTSCNKDYSCLEGDCPSFVRVIPGKRRTRAVPSVPANLPVPQLLVDPDDALLRVIGIGGTGVVTISQVLGMAALLDGKRSFGLDQTGLAQKGGPVVSDIRILAAGNDAHPERSNRAAAGSVDAYIGFDVLGAVAPANLRTADPARTIAVVSTSTVQTGQMIGDPTAHFGPLDQALAAIEARTRAADNIYLDALALSQTLFGDNIPANSIIIGAAWQRGVIPLSLDSIEEAFRLNGAAVEKNIAAFHWGRAVVALPDAVAKVHRVDVQPRQASRTVRTAIAEVGAAPGSVLADLLEVRVADLDEYQNIAYARRYSEFVGRVLRAERESDAQDERVSEAVARQLHRLMAYKDEYEVARLHLDPAERARIRDAFGPDAKIRYMLHPPLLRSLGLKHKIALGSWFDGCFRLLRSLRGLRGTPFDIFGYARIRRIERELPGEYRRTIESALPHLADARDEVLALAELPELVRGYEEIKLRSVNAYRAETAKLLARLQHSMR